MNAETYHLDQNVRDDISKGRMDQQFLKKYRFKKHEAILPFAVLEYARIPIKKILSTIPKLPNSLLFAEPLELKAVKEHFEEWIRDKIKKEYIKEKLEKQLQHDNKYARPFIIECVNVLSEIYDITMTQLSWDRFTQMKWSKDIEKKHLIADIRGEIAKFISKENLYILRLCHYFNEIPYMDMDNEPDEIQKYIDIMQKNKLKPNKDIGDCEFIHTAINGQISPCLKKRLKRVQLTEIRQGVLKLQYPLQNKRS